MTARLPLHPKLAEGIVFFDGVCILCNRFVDHLIKSDHRRFLKYASLQGSKAKELLDQEDLKLSTVIFFQNGLSHRKSKAIGEIFVLLGGYHLLPGLILKATPTFLADYFYDLVAKNRFHWFGRKTECRMPTFDERNLFFD